MDDSSLNPTIREAVQESSPVEPSHRPSFASSAIATFGTNIGVAVLSLVNVLITSRALGPVGRGDIAFLTTMAVLSANIALFGVQEANVNLAGAQPRLRPSLATNSLLLAGLFGTLGAAGIASLIALFPSVGGESAAWIRWVALAAIPILVLQAYFQLLAQADYGFRLTNMAWLIGPVTNVVVNGLLALLHVISVGTVVVTWVAGQTLATTAILWFVARRSGFGPPGKALAYRTVGFGLRTHLGRIMMLGNYRLDQWILGVLAGPRELGIYSVAVAWSEALFFLPTAAAMVQRPDVVRASAPEAARQTAIVFRASVLLTALLAVGLFAVAPILCVGIFGSEFRDSTIDLRILLLGAIGIVALKQLGSALVAQRRPLLSTAGISVALLTTIVLDVILIPSHGAVGAAIASSAAYAAGGVAIAVIFIRALPSSARELFPRRSDVVFLWHQWKQLARRRAPRGD